MPDNSRGNIRRLSKQRCLNWTLKRGIDWIRRNQIILLSTIWEVHYNLAMSILINRIRKYLINRIVLFYLKSSNSFLIGWKNSNLFFFEKSFFFLWSLYRLFGIWKLCNANSIIEWFVELGVWISNSLQLIKLIWLDDLTKSHDEGDITWNSFINRWIISCIFRIYRNREKWRSNWFWKNSYSRWMNGNLLFCYI